MGAPARAWDRRRLVAAQFRYHKVWTHEGGISTPLIVRWPESIGASGELRTAVGHVVDLVPTILDLAGVKVPPDIESADAPPLAGRSLVPTFADDTAIERPYLFFQHEGNRALRVGGYKLVSAVEAGDRWELYNLAADRSETLDLAPSQPALVERLAARWTALERDFRAQAAQSAPGVAPPPRPGRGNPSD